MDEARSTLAAHGLTPAVVYEGDAFANLAGGERRGATFVGDLHLQLAVDGELLVGWRGGSFLLTGLWIHGGRPSQLSGDAQGVSNIDAESGWLIYEAWFQQNILAGHVSLLAGLYDLNSEFYALEAAGLFVNSSFGIGPEFSQTGIEGPSIFPRTAFGGRVAIKPVRGLIVRAAVLDGVPLDRTNGTLAAFRPGDGLLLVSEAVFLSRPTRDEQPTHRRFRIGRFAKLPPYDNKIVLGAWHYTAEFDEIGRGPGEPTGRRSGSSGAYTLADQVLLTTAGRRLAAFAQLGLADDRVNRFQLYVGGGLVAAGLLPGRPGDQLGLAVAAARNGTPYIEGQRERGHAVQAMETALELTFLVQVARWLAVQPDLQYVIAPNTTSSKNAFVAQLTFELAM